MRPGLEARPTQTERIVALLRSRSPDWVPLTDILALKISQYQARIFTARHHWGLAIENRCEMVRGERHSWFRLIESQTKGQIKQNQSLSASLPTGSDGSGRSGELFDYLPVHRDH